MPKNSKKEDGFPALLRGAFLSATLNKQMNYVSLADKKASTIITINAFLIPLSITKLSNPDFMAGVAVLIIAGVLSMLFAIISLLPKNYFGHGHHKSLLHFSGISQFSEGAYLKEMKTTLEEKGRMGEAMSEDIYHVSKLILIPKFRWIRRSYYTFLVGILGGLVLVLMNIF